jgi:ligand-binding SRPBCC domain-containing protein
MIQARPLIRIERQPDGIFRLTTAVLLPHAVDRVFQFVSDTNSLEILISPWFRLRMLTPCPIDMGIATCIDYRLRIHCVPVRWESEITAWEPPFRFVYEQRRGPFRHWVHEHTFLDRNEETLARDHVHYSVPGGRLAHDLFVRRDLERLFLYRRAQLLRIFGKRQ